MRAVARATAPGDGAVRASLGIGSGIDDVETLADALAAMIGSHARRPLRKRSTGRFAAPVAGLLGSR